MLNVPRPTPKGTTGKAWFGEHAYLYGGVVCFRSNPSLSPTPTSSYGSAFLRLGFGRLDVLSLLTLSLYDQRYVLDTTLDLISLFLFTSFTLRRPLLFTFCITDRTNALRTPTTRIGQGQTNCAWTHRQRRNSFALCSSASLAPALTNKHTLHKHTPTGQTPPNKPTNGLSSLYIVPPMLHLPFIRSFSSSSSQRSSDEPPANSAMTERSSHPAQSRLHASSISYPEFDHEAPPQLPSRTHERTHDDGLWPPIPPPPPPRYRKAEYRGPLKGPVPYKLGGLRRMLPRGVKRWLDGDVRGIVERESISVPAAQRRAMTEENVRRVEENVRRAAMEEEMRRGGYEYGDYGCCRYLGRPPPYTTCSPEPAFQPWSPLEYPYARPLPQAHASHSPSPSPTSTCFPSSCSSSSSSFSPSSGSSTCCPCSSPAPIPTALLPSIPPSTIESEVRRLRDEVTQLRLSLAADHRQRMRRSSSTLSSVGSVRKHTSTRKNSTRGASSSTSSSFYAYAPSRRRKRKVVVQGARASGLSLASSSSSSASSDWDSEEILSLGSPLGYAMCPPGLLSTPTPQARSRGAGLQRTLLDDAAFFGYGELEEEEDVARMVTTL